MVFVKKFCNNFLWSLQSKQKLVSISLEGSGVKPNTKFKSFGNKKSILKGLNLDIKPVSMQLWVQMAPTS